MKAPYSWLKEFVEIDLSPADLAELLTRHGAEVESLVPVESPVRGALVGRIVSCRRDEKRPEWTWCAVSIGERSLSALCGAPNARPGLLVPVALPGTTLPGGEKVAEKRFGEAISAGVILSERELGVGDDHSGVMVLDPSLAPGRTVEEALFLTDWVLDVNVTPNRPDLMSVRGIAREISALLKKPLRRRRIRLAETGPALATLAAVQVLDYRLCPRYCARVIRGVKIGPSPFAVRRRLGLCGVRPINNAVDATNYIMLEVGQPLHAFDLSRLAGRTILARPARDGEEIVTIDAARRRLSVSMLVIADAERPVAVAGVMGGAESEVGEGTTDLLLESAYFLPVSVRATSRALGLSTEASRRFERSIDPNLAPEALDLLAGMILETAGGEAAAGRADRKRGPFKKRSVWISPERASALIGVRFTPSAVGAILKRLGLSFETRRGERLRFSVPTFRPDLQRDVDLMEEVARLYGYDRIPETVPLRPMECRPLNGEYVFQEEIRSALIGLGLSEAITFSFISPREPERLGLLADHPGRALVEILNPVNKEQGSLRNTLLPGLLRVVAHNQNRGVESAALFELGTVFFPRPGEAVPREEIRLGIALSRPGEDMSWRRRDPSPDFYTLKGLIEAFLTSLGLDGVEFAAEEHPSFRPGQTAGVVFRGEKIAAAGTIADAVLEAYALSGPVFMAEIALAPLLCARAGSARYRPLPIYPAVRRDIAIIVRNSVSYAEIRNAIESLRPELLEEYRLFDVYRGEPIPSGEKSLAFSLHYRSRCDTLQEVAVAAVHAAFKEALARKLACRFRE